MRQTLIYCFIAFSVLLLSSCATILNQPVQRVAIATDKNIKSVSVSKSLSVDSSLIRIDAPGFYYTVRSPRPLEVELQTDSIKKTVFLKARNSPAYWANLYYFGIGMLVDRDNTKRYAYPKNNYFTVKDSIIKRYAFAPVRKGTMNLSLSLPVPSSFNLQSEKRNYNSVGAFGLQTGVDYFYKNNQYVSLNFGAATDASFAEYFGPGYRELGTVWFANVMNNNVAGSFDLGYGINLSKLQWRRITIRDTINLDSSVKSTTMGFSLSAQHRLGNYFRIGILYQPDLLTLNHSPTFKYQHYISFNLIWKLPIKNAIER